MLLLLLLLSTTTIVTILLQQHHSLTPASQSASQPGGQHRYTEYNHTTLRQWLLRKSGFGIGCARHIGMRLTSRHHHRPSPRSPSSHRPLTEHEQVRINHHRTLAHTRRLRFVSVPLNAYRHACVVSCPSTQRTIGTRGTGA